MLYSRPTLHQRGRLLLLLIALQPTWIVSIAAFFCSKLYVHKPTFGHERQQRPHRKTTAVSTTNNYSFFDMEELQQRIRSERQRPIHDASILKGHPQWRPPKSISSKSQLPLQLDYVYIVSFPEMTNKKETTSSSSLLHSQNGGIHSIESPSGKNVILAFVNQKSCDNFVQHLRRQRFFDPMVRWFYVDLLSTRSIDILCLCHSFF